MVFSDNIKDVYDEVFAQDYSAIFIAVDDMTIRKWLWHKFTTEHMPSKYIIDPRVGGEYANVFSIFTKSSEANTIYGQQLWTNEEVAPLPCTGRAVIDVTLCVVGECIGRFRQAMKNKLQVIWTFHSYNIGSSSIMAHYTLLDGKVKDDMFVASVGGEAVDGQS